MKDLKRLVDLYFALKKIAGILYDIEERHPGAERMKQALDIAIREIDDASHLIFREAHELKKAEGKDA